MLKFISNNNRPGIILFIHGLTGGEVTWELKGHSSFPDLLSQVPEISEHFDIAHFSYYTKLSALYAKSKNFVKFLVNLFPVAHKKKTTILGIEEISNLLKTEVRFRLSSYDNLIVIAHSMGGLVAKSFIVDEIRSGIPSKVKLFITLATPHQGASLATYGKLISSNLQIDDLAPLSTFLNDVNDQWLKSSVRPTTKYFCAAHDSIVAKSSSAPADKEPTDVITVPEDHESICKPEGADDTTFLAVRDLILNYEKEDPAIAAVDYQSLTDEAAYEDEIFVIKMLIADIHNATVKDAKELFLNAEYVRKRFSGTSDQKRFADLFEKIRTVYKDSYSDFIHEGIENSGQLLAQVHKDIQKHDAEFLRSKFMPFLDARHKKGMLHQLANDLDGDIWWTKETGILVIQKFVEEKNGA